VPLIWSGMRIAYHLTASETINVVVQQRLYITAVVLRAYCVSHIRWRWETTHLVLLATPWNLSACLLTGRLNHHWFRRQLFSFY